MKHAETFDVDAKELHGTCPVPFLDYCLAYETRFYRSNYFAIPRAICGMRIGELIGAV